MALTMPTPMRKYFAAEAAGAFIELAQCFGEGARVRDEGQTHVGRAAIAKWMAQAKQKYNHKTEPLSVIERDGKVVAKTRVSGNFPGTPIEIEQRFELLGDEIVSLEIG